ncbi:unnamed protein product [Cuscuta campestris]|uniref:B box-type domain-containing protein n=1 Tax=Cuscuta campestris TaxID=132261 RepID=A0A484NSZ9_9ASTE|nr:unnamed protein product [Cuscuta campestris]
MKIQCEACGEREACFYCVADEAALCSHCDQRVHSANKLSRTHQRFSLLHPSPSHSKPPLCDICQQGKNALFFCEQDRAILCRECDGDIHRPNNERTKKHSRFLLTGVKLSPTLSSFSSSSSSSSSAAANLTNSSRNSKPSNKHIGVLPPPPPPRAIGSGKKEQMMMAAIAEEGDDDGLMMCGGSSPMFEYLEMLPGYHFEELLDPGFGFSQV